MPGDSSFHREKAIECRSPAEGRCDRAAATSRQARPGSVDFLRNGARLMRVPARTPERSDP
jgi:hypothetical protein